MKFEGNLGDDEHEMMKFKIYRKGRKENSRIKLMDFNKTDLNKLEDWLGKIPWEVSLREKGVQEYWQLLKVIILSEQIQTLPNVKERQEVY